MYIPLAPRVNYSLLIMVAIEMMKMANKQGFPPPAGCRNGSRLVFGGYGGFWRQNSRSIVLPKVFRVYGYIWEEEVRRWTSGLSTRQGARPGGGRAPHPRGSPGLSWSNSDTPWDSAGPKINSVKFQVNWTPFGFPFLRNPKTR